MSDKGKIASQLQEIHPLVFSDIYTRTNGFASLSAIDIVALFSCFTSITVKDEYKTYIPKTANIKLNDMAKEMYEMLDYYFALEMSEQVDSGSSYDIQYDIMLYTIMWCEANNDVECKAVIYDVKREKDIFLGEFVKAILKINNIAKEFEKVCEVMNNMTLLEKLKEIPKLTLKYVVTSQSLYV